MKLSTAHMRLRLNIAAMNHDGLRGRRGLDGSAPSRLLLWERGTRRKITGNLQQQTAPQGVRGAPREEFCPSVPGLELQRSEIPRHIPNGYMEASPPAAQPRTAPKGSANRTSCCSPSKWCTNLPQFQKEQGKEGIFWLEGHREMTEASSTRTAACCIVQFNNSTHVLSFYCSLRGFGSSFISTAPLLPFIRSLLHHYGILTACALMKETWHGQGLLLLSYRRQQPRYAIIPFVGEKMKQKWAK